jgi:thiol-disulfide isomerase/thioredoxin
VLVIEFFATWCGGCKQSIPHLANLQKQFGNQGLQILALNIGQGDSLEEVKNFVTTNKISYSVAMADEDVVYDNYGIRMVPTLFIVDKKGVLVEKLNGYNPDIQKMLEATVKDCCRIKCILNISLKRRLIEPPFLLVHQAGHVARKCVDRMKRLAPLLLPVKIFPYCCRSSCPSPEPAAVLQRLLPHSLDAAEVAQSSFCLFSQRL